MNFLRRTFSQIALVAGVLLFSAGIQTFATFTPPTTSPPNANAYAPLSTGPDAQAKTGGLLLNTGGATNGLIVQFGNVGIGTTNPGQKLSVAGIVESTSGGMKFPDGTTQTTAASGGAGNVLGAWEIKAVNTVYQAATDGFVVAWVDGHYSTWFWLKTDGANPPTVVRNYQSTNSDGEEMSVTSPVRKGDYWSVGLSGSNFGSSVYWIPLGS